MKKKILLKSLVAVAPLMGVVTPLASCTTSNTKELLHSNLKNDSVLSYCPIIVYPFGTHTIEADKPLPIPDPLSGEELEEQEIRLYCNNPSFIVKGIDKVVAFTIDGSEVQLEKERDYYLERNESNGFASLYFTKEYVNGGLLDQLPYFISVLPDNVSPEAYNVTFTGPQVQSNPEKITNNIVEGFTQEFTIKEGFTQYKFTSDSITNFNIKLGKGQVLTDYKEIEKDQYDVTLSQDQQTITLNFKPGLNLFDFDLEANTLLYDIPVEGEIGNVDATIKMFDIETAASFPGSLSIGQESFELPMPNSYYGKKIKTAKWHYDSEYGNWRDCIIEPTEKFPDSYVIKPAEHMEVGDENIVIKAEELEPIQGGDFENDSWQNLQHWSNLVKNHKDTDSEREELYKKIYDLGQDEDFVGKIKTVEFDGIPHRVVVASTFQLPLVKTGHETEGVLESDDVDFEKHASFTFQFIDELTNKDHKLVTRIFNDKQFFLTEDDNCGCWEYHYYRFEKEHNRASDLRRWFMEDFEERLNGYIPKDLIAYTAHACHITPTASAFTPDRFFAPTAYQLNGQGHGGTGGDPLYVTENHTQTFEIYDRKKATDNEADFRIFTGAEGCVSNPRGYWTSTPAYHKGGGEGLAEDTIYVSKEGKLCHCNYYDKCALIPCFSIL